MLPVDFSDPAKYYRDLGIGSSLPEPLMAALSKQRTITVKDLGESYYENQRESRITESTLAKTASEMSIMTQLWGGKTPITDLSRGHAIQLIDALKRMTTNGPKRYPGVSLEKMSELEEKKEKPDLISPKTVHNYFDGISSALRFATDEGWLERNPLSSRSLRKRLPEKQKTSKPMMTAADINQVFGSRKYLQERSNGARGEARFWVPILCLLHGVRSNEACQLLVEDVQEEDGIPFIDLRLANDDGEELKAFKTRASIRRIPLHDEIIKMGFLDFVEGQRIKGEVWLFPALSPNSMGSRADAVGKWFGRLRKELIPDLPEVKGAKGLHSFRHLFERTLRDQGVSDTLQYALGGWVDKKPNNSSIDYGGGFGVKVLKEAIDRVLFPGVDFSPLYGAP